MADVNDIKQSLLKSIESLKEVTHVHPGDRISEILDTSSVSIDERKTMPLQVSLVPSIPGKKEF